MRRLVISAMVMGCFVGAAFAEGSKIREVTVYADRARVTRSATVTVAKGEVAEHIFDDLPGWIDDASVRVEASPTGAAGIVDVRVERNFLAKSQSEKILDAQAALQEITDKLAELKDREEVLKATLKQVESMKVFSVDALPKDAAVRKVDIEEYRGVLEFVREETMAVKAGLREIAAERRDLEPERTARARALGELQSLTRLEETSITIALEGRRAGAVEISFTYMLPGATWEPVHEIRSEAGAAEDLHLTSYAVVTQTTGEDWEGATIAFSTQSASETVRIPEIEGVFLDAGKSIRRAAQRQMTSSSFSRAQQTYYAQNGLWIGNNSNVQQIEAQVLTDNRARQMAVQAKVVETFAKVRQRGTTAHFTADGRPTVRTDGRSVRVAIGKADLASTEQIVAAPGVSLNAVRTAKMTNTGAQTILPGAVSLYREGAFVGMTEIDFVAEGEEFDLFMGIADQVKISRVLDKKQSSLVRGKRNRMQLSFLITVENLADEKVSLEIADHVPVSQHEDIRISRIEIRPEVEPDARGILTWEVDLAPRETRELRISYRAEYPADLVQMKSKAAPAQAPVDGKLRLEDLSGLEAAM